MTEGMKLSSKTEAVPLLASEGTGSNEALQLLADRYAQRLARIKTRAPHKITVRTYNYYEQAEAAVRALYADAT